MMHMRKVMKTIGICSMAAIMMAAMEQIPIVFITFLICIICVSS